MEKSRSEILDQLLAALRVGGYQDVSLEVRPKVTEDPFVLGLFTPGEKKMIIKESLLSRPRMAQWVLAHEASHAEQARRPFLTRVVSLLFDIGRPWEGQRSEREAEEGARYYSDVMRRRALSGEGTLPLRYVLATRLGGMRRLQVR